jgi:hypothetical protein
MGWRERRVRRQPVRGRWRAGYWLRHPAFSMAACGLAIGLFGLMAAVTAYETGRLNEHGVQARAVLLEVREDGEYVVARFSTVDGRSIDVPVHDYSWDPAPQVGDTPTVIYDPQAPETLVRDARIAGDYTMTWFAGFVIVFMAGCGWLVAKTWDIWLENARRWRLPDRGGRIPTW